MIINYEKQNRVVLITLNRPEALNAQNRQFHQELGEAFIKFRDDEDAWVAIVHGAGDKAFSAGADIKEFGNRSGSGSVYTRVRAEQIWKPFIAAIHGYCLGGGLQLAMECDLRLAADNARFGFPEVKRGLFAGSSCTTRLPRMVARSHVMELMLLGDQIDAAEAYRMALVNRVVPLKDLMPTALQWADKICQNGPLGVRASKEAIARGYGMNGEEAQKLEAELFGRIWASEDFKEGARAFAEKRRPNFKGR
ncbi:MAG: enoyl-CoA hydratase-related protein [Dehalococcoidales bacterium]|nr:enoyl-CoA hydratase-related protein [Dehalococcoidales bacterium]